MSARHIPICMVLPALLGCPGRSDDTSNSPSGSGDTGCFADDPMVEIGTGEHEFVELNEGASVEMVHGPQGGWHMLGSIRVSNTDDIVRIHYTVTVASSDTVVADNTYQVALVTDQACSGFYPGMYGYLDVSDLAVGDADTPPELIAYEEVVMRMAVEDLSGRTASAEIRVVAEPDPDDVAPHDTGMEGSDDTGGTGTDTGAGR